MTEPEQSRGFFQKRFGVPRPFNWGYSFLFAAIGAAATFMLALIIFESGSLSFSTTSIIGCGLITVMMTTLALMIPSVFLLVFTLMNGMKHQFSSLLQTNRLVKNLSRLVS